MKKIYQLSKASKNKLLIGAIIFFATVFFFPIGVLFLYLRKYGKIILDDDTFQYVWIGKRIVPWQEIVRLEPGNGLWDRMVTTKLIFPVCLWRFERETEIKALILKYSYKQTTSGKKLS